MDEDTTTSAPVETGAASAQPAPAETTVAVEPTDTATEVQTEATTASADDDDAQLADWASKKGLQLDSDNTRKAAKMAREAEKLAGRHGQRAGELEKATQAVADDNAAAEAAATGQDPELLKRLQRVEVKEAVRDFWNDPSHDAAMESKMIEVLADKPYLAGDLDSLYAVAVMQSGGVSAVQSQAKKDTLSELAQKQQAAVPRGNATTHAAPKEKDFKDLSIKEMEERLGFAKR
jgi:hypothetical protein